MKRKHARLLSVIGFAVMFAGPAALMAQVNLGNAQTYAVLGGTTITNTGNSSINGDVGVSPGNAITGFPPGIVTGGSIHAGDTSAAQAQTSLTTAYNNAAALPCGTDLTGQNLGGLTLTPGVYCFASSGSLTGTLTLNMLGDPNAFFLIRTGSTLTVASGSTVVLTNSGGATCPSSVYWQVGSSATLGTGSTFRGNILALTSITLTTNANLLGRALARNGAVTLDTNSVGLCGPAIVCPALTVNPATLPNGVLGAAYNQTITATGATPPVTCAVTSGSLPTGLTLNSASGTITGSPTVAGNFNFSITATDANGCFASRAYSVIIAATCAVVVVNPAALPGGTQGFAYNQQVTGTGGTAPYTFSIAAGALPNGVTLNASTGAITGTPTATGPFNVTIRATDINACTGTRIYDIAIIASTPSGGPTLDVIGLAALMILLIGAGLFVMNRLSL